MGKCGDCKFWAFVAAGFQGACRKTATENGRRYNPSKASAMVSTPTGNAAILFTDPDFGCTQFTKKDNP